jgi:hypothetical protein
MTLKSMGMSPYEQFKVQNMQTKGHTSGLGVAGLATGIGAVVAAVGVGFYACAKAKEAKSTAAAENAGTAALLKQATDFALTQIRDERSERIAGDRTLSISINDTVSGQQSGTLSQSQQLSNDITLGLMTGKYTETPQKVALYRDATPCGCPATGCNCMG